MTVRYQSGVNARAAVRAATLLEGRLDGQHQHLLIALSSTRRTPAPGVVGAALQPERLWHNTVTGQLAFRA